MNTEPWAVLLVIFATIVGALGPIFFKKGSSTFNIKSPHKNHYFILGVFLYGLSSLFFIPALKGGDLSVLYPLVSLSYIWVSLLSVKMLGEKMNKFKWIGVLLIILGVAFIGIGS